MTNDAESLTRSSKGFGKVPRWVVTDGLLSAMKETELKLWIAYCSHANGKSGLSRLSNLMLGQMIGRRPRTVSRIRKKLNELGVIEIVHASGGKCRSAEVKIVLNPVAQCGELPLSKCDTQCGVALGSNLDIRGRKGGHSESQRSTSSVANEQKEQKEQRMQGRVILPELRKTFSTENVEVIESTVAMWPDSISHEAIRLTIDHYWKRANTEAKQSPMRWFLAVFSEDGFSHAIAVQSRVEAKGRFAIKERKREEKAGIEEAEQRHLQSTWSSLAEQDRELWRDRARQILPDEPIKPGMKTIEAKAKCLFRDQTVNAA